MNFRSIALCLTLGTTVSCSPGPVPVSQSLRDPSNPAAQEGVVPTVGAGDTRSGQRSDEAPADGHAHHQHDHGAAGAPTQQAGATRDAGSASAVYTCPMHPEVTSPTPGRCPKCGMNLVPGK